MSPKIMIEVFKLRDTPSYNPFHSVYNRTEWVSYLGRRNLLMGLKEKSKNGNSLNVHVEFAGHLYLI